MATRFRFSEIDGALDVSNGNRKVAAGLLGCSPSTIRNYVRRFPALKSHRQWSPARIRELNSLVTEVPKRPIKTIAAHFGVTVNCLFVNMSRFGIRRGRRKSTDFLSRGD